MKKLIYTGIRNVSKEIDMTRQVIHLPLLLVQKKSEFPILDMSLWDWLFFTSAFGVEAFFGESGYLQSLGYRYGKQEDRFWIEKSDVRIYLKIAIIGGQTQKALSQFGLDFDFISKVSQGEEMARSWSQLYPKDRVLLVVGSHALTRIESILGDEKVHRLEVYEAIFHKENIKQIQELIKKEAIDGILLTSSLGVDALLSHISQAHLHSAKLKLFGIGKTTLSRIENYGLKGEILSPKTEIEAQVMAWYQRGMK